jgi:hypothetical protein
VGRSTIAAAAMVTKDFAPVGPCSAVTIVYGAAVVRSVRRCQGTISHLTLTSVSSSTGSSNCTVSSIDG